MSIENEKNQDVKDSVKTAFALNELADSESAEMAEQAELDSGLQAEVAGTVRLAGLVEMSNQLDLPADIAGLEQNLEAALSEEASKKATPVSRGSQVGWTPARLLAVAATTLLMAGGSYWLITTGPETEVAKHDSDVGNPVPNAEDRREFRAQPGLFKAMIGPENLTDEQRKALGQLRSDLQNQDSVEVLEEVKVPLVSSSFSELGVTDGIDEVLDAPDSDTNSRLARGRTSQGESTQGPGQKPDSIEGSTGYAVEDQFGDANEMSAANGSAEASPTYEKEIKNHVQTLVDDYNKLVDEDRTDEAKVIVERARNLDPGNPAVEVMDEKLKLLENREEYLRLKSAKEAHFIGEMKRADEVAAGGVRLDSEGSPTTRGLAITQQPNQNPTAGMRPQYNSWGPGNQTWTEEQVPRSSQGDPQNRYGIAMGRSPENANGLPKLGVRGALTPSTEATAGFKGVVAGRPVELAEISDLIESEGTVMLGSELTTNKMQMLQQQLQQAQQENIQLKMVPDTIAANSAVASSANTIDLHVNKVAELETKLEATRKSLSASRLEQQVVGQAIAGNEQAIEDRVASLEQQKLALGKSLGPEHPELKSVERQIELWKSYGDMESRDQLGVDRFSQYQSGVDQAVDSLNAEIELMDKERKFHSKRIEALQAQSRQLAENNRKIEQIRAAMIQLAREQQPVVFYYSDYKDRDPSSNEQYELPPENSFLAPTTRELARSTFSLDVDTASYSNSRRFLTGGRLPPANAVRVEEFVNYFGYEYAEPTDGKPFAVNMEVANCPWNESHKLLRVGLKGKEIARDDRPPSNLVFLIDVSGSMSDQNKLPLLQRSMLMLVDRLTENDRVSIVTYAGNAGLRLEPTSGDQKDKIRNVIHGLTSGGSTHGSAEIRMAYEKAVENFIPEGTNRVILATDGDLNVGVTADDALVTLIKDKAELGVFLSVLGFGTGNLKDAKLEKLADNGNGQYSYIDSIREARKVLVEEMTGSLITIAKDVKVQIEFNPAEIAGYRLIGYENRVLKNEDFDNDAVDAGDIGTGHTVTAFYELIPVGAETAPEAPLEEEPLKYQLPGKSPASEQEITEGESEQELVLSDAARSGELVTLALRYKQPEATKSERIEFVVKDSNTAFDEASQEFRFATSVASFGMLLRHSRHAGSWRLDDVENAAANALGDDDKGHRAEFIDLVRQTRNIIKH